MTDAPDTIWLADPAVHPDPNRKGFLSALDERGAVHTIEYIRADLVKELRPTDMFGAVVKSEQTTFNSFWDSWPNKTAKAAARRAWDKLKPEHKQAAQGTASSWFEAWRKKNPDASPILPASYLNGHRWADTGETPATKAVTSEHLVFWADLVNSNKMIHGGVSPQMADMLIAKGLVTAERMRERT